MRLSARGKYLEKKRMENKTKTHINKYFPQGKLLKKFRHIENVENYSMNNSVIQAKWYDINYRNIYKYV